MANKKSSSKSTENNNEKEVEKITAEVVVTDAEPDLSGIEVNNSRIGRVLSLQEETERQNEIEKLRGKRIRQEQEYIDRMSLSVEENLRNTKEERRYNEEFEERIRYEVYRMHGISEDKLQGMDEYKNAWYQGAAFALFFLSLVLIVLCGVLHGFGDQITIFMAFFTAIEGALLTNGKKSKFFSFWTKVLYLALFPTMMVAFVCYELGFDEYSMLIPIFVVVGVCVLIFGAITYFIYDPYRQDRKNKKKANSYIKDMEKAALKEVKLKQKAYEKLEKQKAKEEEKEKQRQEAKERRSESWKRFKNWFASLWPWNKAETADSDSHKDESKEDSDKAKSGIVGADVVNSETEKSEAQKSDVEKSETEKSDKEKSDSERPDAEK